MKLYNERLGKIIEGTPMMAKLLSAKGWVEVIGEPILCAPEVFEITVDNGEVIATPIEESKPEQPWDTDQEYEDNKPKADPVKKAKAKTKNKK